jgi:hypothetical protein
LHFEVSKRLLEAEPADINVALQGFDHRGKNSNQGLGSGVTHELDLSGEGNDGFDANKHTYLYGLGEHTDLSVGDPSGTREALQRRKTHAHGDVCVADGKFQRVGGLRPIREGGA